MASSPPQYPNLPPRYPPPIAPRTPLPSGVAIPPPPLPAQSPRVAIRPTGVKVIAIIGIIHAGLGIIGFLATGIMLLASGNPIDPTMKAIKANGFLYTWALGSAALGLALALLQLFASIAALSMRSWARKALMLWAMAWLLLSIAGVVVNLAVQYPLLEQNPDIPPDTLLLAKVFGLSAGVLLGIVWPSVVAFYLQEKSVKQSFRRAAEGNVVL